MLSGAVPLGAALQERSSGIEELAVLTAGTSHAAEILQELLGSAAMGSLLEHLAQSADLVILPARAADSVLLLMRERLLDGQTAQLSLLEPVRQRRTPRGRAGNFWTAWVRASWK